MQGNRRLMRDYLTSGSCDCSYSLRMKRVSASNIFRQQGNFSIVMRKLAGRDPDIRDARAPADFPRDGQGKDRAHPRHRRDRQRQDDDAGRDPERDQRDAIGPRRHARRPDRIRASRQPRRLSISASWARISTISQRPARRLAPGAEGHSRRRNARSRDGGNRAHRRGNRSPRAQHAAHDRCRPVDQSYPRSCSR